MQKDDDDDEFQMLGYSKSGVPSVFFRFLTASPSFKNTRPAAWTGFIGSLVRHY